MAHSYNSIHTYACLGWVHGSDGVDSVDHALLLEEGRAPSTRLLLRSLLPQQQSPAEDRLPGSLLVDGKWCLRREPSAPLDVPAFPHSSIRGILAASSGELFSEWPGKAAGDLSSVRNAGARPRLVMRMVHSRRPLPLGLPSRAFALTRATLSRSQTDLILFLITKQVQEPICWRICQLSWRKGRRSGKKER